MPRRALHVSLLRASARHAHRLLRRAIYMRAVRLRYAVRSTARLCSYDARMIFCERDAPARRVMRAWHTRQLSSRVRQRTQALYGDMPATYAFLTIIFLRWPRVYFRRFADYLRADESRSVASRAYTRCVCFASCAARRYA